MRLTILLRISVLAISTVCQAQQPAALEKRISEVLALMSSKQVSTRNAALEDLIAVMAEGRQLGFDPAYGDVLAEFLMRHPGQADRVKLGLITLLNRGNDAFIKDKHAPATYTENDSEHYALAIEMVASLNDERAIPALVGAMTTGGVAAGGLLKFGEKALRPVLNELNNPNPLVRSTAVSTAITILRTKNDPASQVQILTLIRMAIRDPEYVLRSSALYAIENLSDEQQFVPALKALMPALQDMSQHDPYLSSFTAHYPLRERATKLLEKIAKP